MAVSQGRPKIGRWPIVVVNQSNPRPTIKTGELVFFSLRLVFRPILSSRSVARGDAQGNGPSGRFTTRLNPMSRVLLLFLIQSIAVQAVEILRDRHGTTSTFSKLTRPRLPQRLTQ